MTCLLEYDQSKGTAATRDSWYLSLWCGRMQNLPVHQAGWHFSSSQHQGMFSCRSANGVYVIACTAWNAVYIGETGCLLRERMNWHRYSLKHKHDTPVADHFKKKDHKMAVRVLREAQENVAMRSWEKNGSLSRRRTIDCKGWGHRHPFTLTSKLLYN